MIDFSEKILSMSPHPLHIVILAAGKGTRMYSKLPKCCTKSAASLWWRA